MSPPKLNPCRIRHWLDVCKFKRSLLRAVSADLEIISERSRVTWIMRRIKLETYLNVIFRYNNVFQSLWFVYACSAMLFCSSVCILYRLRSWRHEANNIIFIASCPSEPSWAVRTITWFKLHTGTVISKKNAKSVSTHSVCGMLSKKFLAWLWSRLL